MKSRTPGMIELICLLLVISLLAFDSATAKSTKENFSDSNSFGTSHLSDSGARVLTSYKKINNTFETRFDFEWKKQDQADNDESEIIASAETQLFSENREKVPDQFNTSKYFTPYHIPRILNPVPNQKPIQTPPLSKTIDYSSNRDQSGIGIWNGCAKTALRLFKHHGRSKTCAQDIVYSGIGTTFAKHIERYLFSCMIKSAEKIGLPKPERGAVTSMSAFRPGSRIGNGRPSEHAMGRALDVGAFELYFSDRQPVRIEAHAKYYHSNNQTKTFYNEFRKCWRESLRGCDYIGGSIGCTGSGGYNNSDHNDHIHLQFSRTCDR